MAIVTGDQYLESLVKIIENLADKLLDGTLVLKLNPVGLRYVQSRLEALSELESLLVGAPVDYLRAYVSELGDYRALEQLRRILRLLPSLKVVSVLPARDPTPLSLVTFGRLMALELRGCDLSTSAAKGLVELRFTLERLVCHNSTDALRHVFASRIIEIKDSPQWNRLSFVSCACNGLVLMDESLELLPIVETLDLSRNKFAMTNNLRKCTRLRHLDLGFNSLRSIASLSEVHCQIVTLVLRNNALTTLNGIENMKSLEGLDLSYNIISNFSGVEILAGLPSLQNLWLEGNPICYARWFRAQVFGLFPQPEKLKLDDKTISASELWMRQIIVASRKEQPASFGFYLQAKNDTDFERNMYMKKKKRIPRLANIESEEQRKNICSDQDSFSCDNEIQSKYENVITDEESEIKDIMKRIESMKKEHSVLWLQEFKEWIKQTSEEVADNTKLRGCFSSNNGEIRLESDIQDVDPGESSKCVSDSIHPSGNEMSTVVPESGTSSEDLSTVINGQQNCDRSDEAGTSFYTKHTDIDKSVAKELDVNQQVQRFLSNEGCVSEDAGDTHLSTLAADKVCAKNVISPTAITDIMKTWSPSASAGSPPHFQEGILHRHHNLKEEYLQLSSDSLSIASSDSNSSCSEDDSSEFGPSITQVDQSISDNSSGRSVSPYEDDASEARYGEISLSTQNGGHTFSYCDEGNFVSIEGRETTRSCIDSFIDAVCNDGVLRFSTGQWGN